MSDDTSTMRKEMERRMAMAWDAPSGLAAFQVVALLNDRDALAERCEKLREALQELVCCDEIVKHGQHERGEKVKGGRWAKAWDRASAALKDVLAEKEGK